MLLLARLTTKYSAASEADPTAAGLRVSVSAFNTEQEVGRLLKGLEEELSLIQMEH